MINGVSLSELNDINLTKMSHYRRISQVQQSNYSRFSVLEPQLTKVFHNRKVNHEKWKKFNQTRFATEIQKSNDTFRKKLEKIKFGKSIYTLNHSNSPRHTKGSSFLNRKRNLEHIHIANPGIARKIINARGSLERKNETQFSRYKDNVQRLQRFSMVQRMTSFSQRRTKVKTQVSPKNKMLSPSTPKIEKKLSLFYKSFKSKELRQ